jgi:imidazoleglycerol phosphate synthase cyclase subunit
MVMRRIIPCLDVRDGRIVKGVRFANLRDAGDPAERALMYERQGADEIVLLDVSATAEGRAACLQTVRAVRSALSIPLTVGGGIRSMDDAGRMLDAGADRVSLNTAAVERPEVITDVASRFGTQCTVLALDATRNGGDFEALIRSGTERTGQSAVEWARRAATLGAGEILLTSFDRDGTRSGYDLDLIRAVSAAVAIPVIASGGASTADHMVEAFEAGADAVLAASIFHDSEMTVADVKRQLRAHNVSVRL